MSKKAIRETLGEHVRYVHMFEPGDRVAYARTFLRDTGQPWHGLASMRGTVTETMDVAKNRQLVSIAWDSETDWPANVLNTNLWPADRIHLEPA
jgi:hypothetical protein